MQYINMFMYVRMYACHIPNSVRMIDFDSRIRLSVKKKKGTF